jgi:hypothetical protein
MLVRTGFRFVMDKLFFGNDKVLLGVEVDDDPPSRDSFG